MVVFSIRVSRGKLVVDISRNGGTALDGVAPVGISILSNVRSTIALSSTRSVDITTRYRSPVIGELVGPGQIVVGILVFVVFLVIAI
jgi:hypothetical protein